MNTVLKRKLKSAFFSSLFIPAVVVLGCLVTQSFEGIIPAIIIFFYAGIGNLIYGMPVSYLSDWLTKSLKRTRFAAAAFIHIFFAAVTAFFIEGLGVYAVGCSVLFFLADEWQKRERGLWNKKVLAANTLAIVSFAALGVYSSLLVVDVMKKETNDYYLIPKGFEGKITVLYNIDHAPKPEKIGKYNVIRINEIGYGITPLPESEGIITDKYYYIDEKGNKERIDEDCIHIGGSGSTSGEGYEYTFSNFTVTNTMCGEKFSMYGSQYLEDQSWYLEEFLLREGLAEIGDDGSIEPKKQKD